MCSSNSEVNVIIIHQIRYSKSYPQLLVRQGVAKLSIVYNMFFALNAANQSAY